MRESGSVTRRRLRQRRVDVAEGDDERLHGEGKAIDHRPNQQARKAERERMPDQRNQGASHGRRRTKAHQQIEAQDRRRKHQRERNCRLRDSAGKAVAARKPCSQRRCQQEQANRRDARKAKR
jgi:hypothetical protein